MDLKEITKLNNNKLIEVYKSVREKFLKAEPFSQADEEISRIYGLLIKEVKKRSLEVFNMYM
jgi:hypothetical protein